MTFTIEFSDQANVDLRDIYAYIAYELQSIENARGQLARLEESITHLAYMPERFRKYEIEPWHSRGLHVMPVDHYCVLYIPDAEKAIVTITRIMYGGRDIDKQLRMHMI
jgi:toxin ParE1/3/4